jgi:hypothetical protein
MPIHVVMICSWKKVSVNGKEDPAKNALLSAPALCQQPNPAFFALA